MLAVVILSSILFHTNGVFSDADISSGIPLQISAVIPGKLVYFDEHNDFSKLPFRFSDIIRENRRPVSSPSRNQNNLGQKQPLTPKNNGALRPTPEKISSSFRENQQLRSRRPDNDALRQTQPAIGNVQNNLLRQINATTELRKANLEQKRYHYRKGKLRQVTKDIGKPGERQGLNCPGVCKYIPDIDYCPTGARQTESDSEAADYNYDEDYYDGNDVEDREPQDSKSNRPLIFHAVPIPHFVLSKASSELLTSGLQQQRERQAERERDQDTTRQRQPLTARRENRRNRRPQLPSGQNATSPGSALEQELVLKRWDRVVERGPYLGGDVVEVEPGTPPGVLLRPGNFIVRRRWPRGVIPYEMDTTLNTCRQDVIFDAMDEIEAKTCIRFVERERERNYVNIQGSGIGCSSYVGMIGGVQNLNLSRGCFSKFTVVHELLHTVGFEHEQARDDRDNFVQIDFDNVIRGKERQFEKEPGFGSGAGPYDLRSIMHYSAFLFARNRCEPTIYPVDNSFDICDLGAGDGRGGMTSCDAAKINKMYACGRNFSTTCTV